MTRLLFLSLFFIGVDVIAVVAEEVVIVVAAKVDLMSLG
jgi:hypothetical protein